MRVLALRDTLLFIGAMVLSACGSPQRPRADAPGFHLEVGRAYHVERVSELRFDDDIVRETLHAELRVTGEDRDGWTVRFRVARLELEEPTSPVVLPRVEEPRLELELRIDRQGRVTGAPAVVDGAERSPEELARLVGWLDAASVLVRGPLKPGARWTASDRWIHRSLDRAETEGAHALEVTVEEVERERAALHLAGSVGGEGEEPLAIEGNIHMALADPMVGEGRIVARRGDEPAMAVAQCTRPAGGEPCPRVGPLIHPTPSAERPRAARYEAASCDARVELMTERLRRAERGSLPLGEPPIDPPRLSAGAPITAPAPILDTDGQRHWIDGRLLEWERVLDHLGTIRRNASVIYPARGDGPLEILVRADHETALRALLPLLEQVSAFGPLRLVVQGDALPPLTPFEGSPAHVTQLVERLRGLDGDERARAIGAGLDAAVGPCAPVISAFGRSVGAPRGERHARLARRVPGAVASCRCTGIDVDLLEAVIVSMAEGPGTDQLALPLPLSDAPDAERLTLPRSATVGDLARALADRSAAGRGLDVRLR